MIRFSDATSSLLRAQPRHLEERRLGVQQVQPVPVGIQVPDHRLDQTLRLSHSSAHSSVSAGLSTARARSRGSIRNRANSCVGTSPTSRRTRAGLPEHLRQGQAVRAPVNALHGSHGCAVKSNDNASSCCPSLTSGTSHLKSVSLAVRQAEA